MYLPIFFFQGKIIKKIGHLNSIIIGLATLSIRFFLYFIITDPLWVLPVELLGGLGYALPYSAMTAYGAVIAPEGLKGTIQGLIGTVYQGIGKQLNLYYYILFYCISFISFQFFYFRNGPRKSYNRIPL